MTARSSSISPAHPLIKEYLRSLGELRSQGVEHELALRRPFENLLDGSARLHGWTLIAELGAKSGGRNIRPDGTLRDSNSLPRGYWEAKDTRDDLGREIERKIRQGYPISNTIFEDTRRAVLYQDRARSRDFDLADPVQVSDLLHRFYSHTEPEIRDFEKAVEEFEQRVPQLAKGLAEKIDEAHQSNPPFQQAFASFFTLCQVSLNPNIRREAVDEMLVQHLLTERLFRTIFDNPEFTRRNVIAVEVERVIGALVSRSFSRDEYLKSLDSFYAAIERAARTISDFGDKQHFLNTIYERFFRGYSVKVADTHGIIYTPQPIVNYMWASVEEALKTEFGLELSSPGVNILDPCTGTGNFIVNLMHRVPKRDLPRVYKEQLFANEVMLMPYYIAALNIEHAYLEIAGNYESFEGICFVDTLDQAEGRQMPMFAEKNTERVERERRAQITVIIGNPPYNVGQINENDNNKNRKYEVIDRRINETYAHDSAATLTNKLYDPYVKFFRWATDRLEDRDGIVCFVSNNSFVDQIAFDGMRKHLMKDFTHIDHVDLHGNVRKNPKLSGTTHNVFGIQVGVGITLAVRCKGEKRLRYFRVPENWRKEEKLAFLSEGNVHWRGLRPDIRNTWLVPENVDEFAAFGAITESFRLHSLGVATNRDGHAYSFNENRLERQAEQFIELYNQTLDVIRRRGGKAEADAAFDTADQRIKWTRQVKSAAGRLIQSEFDRSRIRRCLYRPFTGEWLYFDSFWNEEQYRQPLIFPTPAAERENRLIAVSQIGYRAPTFNSLMTDCIPDLHVCAAVDGHQCFPFYIYDPDGSNRKENITDEALNKFRSHYGNPQVTKWDVFYYIYAILHHPGYREKFGENLKRELPRIPFAPDFPAFVKAGEDLAYLHLNYDDAEKIKPWPLKWVENPKEPLSYKVIDKMRLSKDKTSLTVNLSLTLAGIPPEAFEYRLGNRSALEWVIDQYRVTEDARSGIKSDPNREDDPEYIVRLVGQVIRVSMETVRIVNALPAEFG